MGEIGSEFYTNSCASGENRYFTLMPGQRNFILSGRTGLGYIAEDLLIKRGIKRIALPAYCCATMIAPFASRKIEILFYEQENFRQTAEKADAVLLMDYFGFSDRQTLQNAKFCQASGIPFIVDATQTAFSRLKTYELCDYLVCSYRKWTDTLCASVYCRDGFKVSFFQNPAPDYLEMWRHAASEKRNYLYNGIGQKQQFLNHYAKANMMLRNRHEHIDTSAEEVSVLQNVSSDFLRQRRRENASFLMNSIQEMKNAFVKLLFTELQQEDCPLFVPVLLPEGRRMQIRQSLIEAQIYCPIHWPVEERFPHMETSLHRTEMSLICDQRYDLRDMERIISELKKCST